MRITSLIRPALLVMALSAAGGSAATASPLGAALTPRIESSALQKVDYYYHRHSSDCYRPHYRRHYSGYDSGYYGYSRPYRSYNYGHGYGSGYGYGGYRSSYSYYPRYRRDYDDYGY